MPTVKKVPVRGEETTARSTGWGAVARRQAESEERKSEMTNKVRDFWLKPEETATVQFLDNEPYCYDAHSVRDRKGNWAVVPCQLNTGKHCCLCSEGVKQTWRAAFKILDYRGTWNTTKKDFNHDKPQERIWRVGATLAQQIKQIVDKKGRPLTELVMEVTRSGTGKDSTYNFETAFDADDRKLKPITWKSDTPPTEELCLPPTDDDVDRYGYSSAD